MTTAILNSQAIPHSGQPQQTAEAVPEALEIESLHRQHSQRIFRFLLASVRDREIAETLTQDTFIRAWGARDRFRGECSPATWLTRIALNLLRDHTRTNRFKFWRKVAETSVDATDVAGNLRHPATATDSSLIAHQQLGLVWESVARLPERQRTVFLLRFVEDLELTEISHITGQPMSTVKTHLYRGLAVIRRLHADARLTGAKEPK